MERNRERKIKKEFFFQGIERCSSKERKKKMSDKCCFLEGFLCCEQNNCDYGERDGKMKERRMKEKKKKSLEFEKKMKKGRRRLVRETVSREKNWVGREGGGKRKQKKSIF